MASLICNVFLVPTAAGLAPNPTLPAGPICNLSVPEVVIANVSSFVPNLINVLGSSICTIFSDIVKSPPISNPPLTFTSSVTSRSPRIYVFGVISNRSVYSLPIETLPFVTV